MIFHVILGITLCSIGVHLFRTRSKGFSRGRVVEVCLLNLLFVQWGIGGVWIAIPHIVVPDTVAGYIGWVAGSPFQLELGFASLGIAILGVLSMWFRGRFWVAPVVAQSTFLLGAAYVHIQDISVNANLAPGNAGPILFYDIVIPVIACGLLFAHYRFGGMKNA